MVFFVSLTFQTLTLHFESFALDSKTIPYNGSELKDRLFIHDGYDHTADLMATCYGTKCNDDGSEHFPQQNYVSSGNSMFLTLDHTSWKLLQGFHFKWGNARFSFF